MNPHFHNPTWRGEVFYDAECALCARGAERWAGIFERRGFHWLPLQTPQTASHLGVTDTALRMEMKLRFADGQVVGGLDTWVALFRSVWWLCPLGWLLSLPGFHHLGRLTYRWIARNRHCLGGVCAVPRKRHADAWLPLLLLPPAVWLLRDKLPAWAFMWTLALALYAGCKWLTLRTVAGLKKPPTAMRRLGYLLGWVGMDAAAFLDDTSAVRAPRISEWLGALANILLGAALIWGVVRLVPAGQALAAGWVGMVGIVFLLHFGAFHLLALCWRARGVNATPLMRNPLRATSVAEFWGQRWNTAFHNLVYRFAFRTLARSVGLASATLLVFLVSGLIHDLVISVPARGGYGLPTGYFLLQGLGVLGEHTRPGRRLGLGQGWRGWLFTLFITAAPAFWLFHPPFIHRVILPMLHALGAT